MKSSSSHLESRRRRARRYRDRSLDRLLTSVAGIGVVLAATRDAGNGGQHVPVEDLVVMVIGRRDED